ncbi:MAG: FtsX-like permease family protein [Acidimicrobiia bacterium]
MWKVAFRGLSERRVRLGSTALAIALGVAFAVAVLIVSDTLQRAYSGLFDEVVGGAQLVVQSPKQFGGSNTPRARFPQSTLEMVRRVEGVGRAEGVVRGAAQFIDRDGSPISNGPAPGVGFSWPELGEQSPLRVTNGERPRGPNDVAMDVETARRHGFRVGDEVAVVANGPATRFRISGLFTLGNRSDVGGVTVAAFATPTAQQLFASPSSYDAVFMVTDPRASVPQVQEAIAAQLPGLEVGPSASFARQVGAPIQIALSVLTQVLLGFAAIGLLVGSFIVFNTFAVLVSQRTRELGRLRALGASPRQLFVSVVVEAVIVGAFAGAVGFGLGVVAAKGITAVLPSAGLAIPDVGLVVLGRTVVVGVVVGVVVTTAAALIPAARAAFSSPVVSLNEYGQEAARSRPTRVVFGVLVAACAASALAVAVQGAAMVFEYRAALAVLGIAAVLAALVVLGPMLFRPLLRIVSAPIPRRLAVARLAERNAQRNPRRTSSTALALVVGVALVTVSVVLVNSFQTSLTGGVERGLRADLVLTGQQFRGFSSDVENRVNELPSVALSSGIRFSDAQVQGQTNRVAGMRALGPRLSDLVDLDVVDGDPATLDDQSILVYADAVPGARAGQMIDFQLLGSGTQPLRVAAVYRNRQFTGLVPVSFVITQAAFDRSYGGSAQDTYALVRSKGDTAGAKREIDALLRQEFPTVSVYTAAEFAEQQQQPVDIAQRILIALLVLSVLIALLGVLNTLLLSVYERTRELGLLRVVGMQRRQIFRMVCGESLLISFVGCCVGVGVGLLWSWSVVRVLADQGLTTFTVPVAATVALVVVGSVAGVVAALAPAARAARLDMLRAVAEE